MPSFNAAPDKELFHSYFREEQNYLPKPFHCHFLSWLLKSSVVNLQKLLSYLLFIGTRNNLLTHKMPCCNFLDSLGYQVFKRLHIGSNHRSRESPTGPEIPCLPNFLTSIYKKFDIYECPVWIGHSHITTYQQVSSINRTFIYVVIVLNRADADASVTVQRYTTCYLLFTHVILHNVKTSITFFRMKETQILVQHLYERLDRLGFQGGERIKICPSQSHVD